MSTDHLAHDLLLVRKQFFFSSSLFAMSVSMTLTGETGSSIASLKPTILSANAFIELHFVASAYISSGMLFRARAIACKPR